jgi:methylenetetrahydrofolate reductase (NADPH)
MRITEKFKKPGKIFSFEFYPPKTEGDAQKLYETIKNLKAFGPDFVSITNSSTGVLPYNTAALSGVIKEKLGLEVMAHLTCIGHTKAAIADITGRLKSMGIENVLALRGDIHNIEGSAPQKDYKYACELVKDLAETGAFCVGVAGYPEKHPEAPDFETDIRNLKNKIDAGAGFVITQLFFENRFYFEFVDRALKAGAAVPVLPGLMPLTSYNQLRNFTKMFNVTLPRAITENIEKYAGDTESLLKFSVDYATAQAADLIKNGAPGIHFYTLNRSKATKEILKNLK